MIRTKHAIIAVVCVLVILLGLLIAVRVFAPDETEFVPLPAAVFSAVVDGAVRPVTILPHPRTETSRAALTKKIETQEEPEAIETDSLPVVEPTPEPLPMENGTPTTSTTTPVAALESDSQVEISEEVEIATEAEAETAESPSEEENQPIE